MYGWGLNLGLCMSEAPASCLDLVLPSAGATGVCLPPFLAKLFSFGSLESLSVQEQLAVLRDSHSLAFAVLCLCEPPCHRSAATSQTAVFLAILRTSAVHCPPQEPPGRGTCLWTVRHSPAPCCWILSTVVHAESEPTLGL